MKYAGVRDICFIDKMPSQMTGTLLAQEIANSLELSFHDRCRSTLQLFALDDEETQNQ